MPDSAGPSLFWAPFVAFGVVGVLALILRWAWSGRKDSLLSTPARSGAEGDYGLLVPVAVPRDAQDGQRLAQQLDEHGVRNTLTTTTSGLRLLVFPDDLANARQILGPDAN
jgi:hypothetical protein